MKQSKKLGAGLLALALPTMIFAMSSVGANAATVSSTVDAIDKCVWEISNNTVSTSLTSTEKYVGDALTVTGTLSSLGLGFTGSLAPGTGTGLDANTSTECSFYNNIQNNKITATVLSQTGTAVSETGAAITTQEIGQLFQASYGTSGAELATYTPDSDMNFEISTTRALTLTGSASAGKACNGAFTSPGSGSITSAGGSMDAIVNSGGLSNTYAGAANIRCTGDFLLSIDVKAVTGVPAGAGMSYSFTGPEVVFALSPIAQPAQ